MFILEVQVRPYIPAPAHTLEYPEPSSIPELQVVLINGFRSAQSHKIGITNGKDLLKCIWYIVYRQYQ